LVDFGLPSALFMLSELGVDLGKIGHWPRHIDISLKVEGRGLPDRGVVTHRVNWDIETIESEFITVLNGLWCFL
jgi:hypothetical protein